MSYLETYEQDDPSFIQDLKDSQRAVMVAARWLLDKGYSVTVKPLRIRPTVEQMSEYSDDGDLEINERIEVKGRKIDFTSKEDFPYPSIIVDVAHSWDNAKPKPAMYILFNKSMTHIALVRRGTSSKWSKVTKMDRFKNRERTFYECPIELVEFQKIL